MKLRCIAGKNGGVWRSSVSLHIIDGPKYNEIVTFDGIADDDHIFLVEHPNTEGWEAKWFVPIDGDEKIEELLEEHILEKACKKLFCYQEN